MWGLRARSSPEAVSAITHQHRDSDHELDRADHTLQHHVPGGALKGDCSGQLERRRGHVEQAGQESNQYQPEHPAPPPDDTDPEDDQEDRESGQEGDFEPTAVGDR